ncbi:signal transduction histidine kinase [Murinocardiopsis flavida]|uniref:histidine kinase n=1 Tax=Murinocardiopsis flavida TaxID=645275 RepID=A0A2P8D3G6_9ACTN|nr:histidine kinase [Murinocardiopsis flavida]PSK91762.1 signal transduction histidine kinase [Murinocardiopsis flavida]
MAEVISSGRPPKGPSARGLATRAYAFVSARPRPSDLVLAFGAVAIQLLSWATAPEGAGGTGGTDGAGGVDGTVGTGVAAVALICLPPLALIWRSTHPTAMFVFVSLGAWTWTQIPLASPVAALAPLYVAVALYSLARYARTAVGLAGLGVLCAFILTDTLGRFGSDPAAWPGLAPTALLQSVILLGFPIVIWTLGHSRRRMQEDAERLRRLAEQLRAERELSTRRALAAERNRIAHDLHDVVAHHISGIAVVAHANNDELADDPDAVRDGMRTIATAADTALGDMRRLLGLLANGAPDTGPAPEASLDRLDRLVAPARAAGCTVVVETKGPFGDLSASLRTTAHRVVQEGVTNVIKHAAPADVTVTVLRTGASLSVEVVNGPPERTRERFDGTGLGLLGLRERTGIFAGTLTSGPETGGGWRLRATFPLDPAGDL